MLIEDVSLPFRRLSGDEAALSGVDELSSEDELSVISEEEAGLTALSDNDEDEEEAKAVSTAQTDVSGDKPPSTSDATPDELKVDVKLDAVSGASEEAAPCPPAPLAEARDELVSVDDAGGALDVETGVMATTARPAAAETSLETDAVLALLQMCQPTSPAVDIGKMAGKTVGKTVGKMSSKTTGKMSSKAAGKTTGKMSSKAASKAAGKAAGKAVVAAPDEAAVRLSLEEAQLEQARNAMTAEHNYFTPLSRVEAKEVDTDSASEGEPHLVPCLPDALRSEHGYCRPFFPLEDSPAAAPPPPADTPKAAVTPPVTKTRKRPTKRRKLIDVTNLQEVSPPPPPPPPPPKRQFKARRLQDEMHIAYSFLLTGIDDEDVGFVKRRYAELLQLEESTQTYWLNDTHWVEHTPTADIRPQSKRRKHDEPQAKHSSGERTK